MRGTEGPCESLNKAASVRQAVTVLAVQLLKKQTAVVPGKTG